MREQDGETATTNEALRQALQEPLTWRDSQLGDSIGVALLAAPALVVVGGLWLLVGLSGLTLLAGSLVCGLAVVTDPRNAAIVGDIPFLLRMGIVGAAILATLGITTWIAAWMIKRAR